MPVNAIVLERNAAPARMNMIMQVTRVAPITLSTNDRQVSERLQAAITSEPSTPNTAHSVAVAQPTTSTQTMNRMSRLTGISSRDRLSFWRNESGSPAGGTRSGWRSDQYAM